MIRDTNPTLSDLDTTDYVVGDYTDKLKFN